ncbi:PIN domain-containing protein [Cyanobium sp. FGCU-52]|nr:PIN domain-containing protein [Cyanobium sp. FGCU52]
MIIALDTNVWLKERMLRSAAGAALLYAVSRGKSRILLPDSTRREIFYGVKEWLTPELKKINDGLDLLRGLAGLAVRPTIPAQEQIHQGVEARLNELAHLIQALSITPAHLTAAMDRVIDHRPPAKTKEQFRDSLLWECILEQDEECLFVTTDKDFLDNGLLHPFLKEESKGRVKVFDTIIDLVRALEPHLPLVNKEQIASAIASAVEKELRETDAAQGWRLGSVSTAKIELYATEKPDTLVVAFVLECEAFDCTDLDGMPVEEGILRATGESLLVDYHTVSELKLERVGLCDLSGAPLRGGAVYVHLPTLYIGSNQETTNQRRVPFLIRSD